MHTTVCIYIHIFIYLYKLSLTRSDLRSGSRAVGLLVEQSESV